MRSYVQGSGSIRLNRLSNSRKVEIHLRLKWVRGQSGNNGVGPKKCSKVTGNFVEKEAVLAAC